MVERVVCVACERLCFGGWVKWSKVCRMVRKVTLCGTS